LSTRYYVSSLPSDAVSAKRFQESILRHWAVENCLHLETDKEYGRQTRFSECGVGGGLDVSDENGGNGCASDKEEGADFAGNERMIESKTSKRSPNVKLRNGLRGEPAHWLMPSARQSKFLPPSSIQHPGNTLSHTASFKARNEKHKCGTYSSPAAPFHQKTR
jgi:hypothetical protein